MAKNELNEKVLLKLKSPHVLNPTAEYVDELRSIYEKYQNDTSKDNELIKLAIIKVTTLPDIWESIPPYLRPTNHEKVDEIVETEQREIIEHICKAICDTRNEIAHAKANYTKKGNECPLGEKEAFVKMLDIIAVRCIRWFALQAEEKRVV